MARAPRPASRPVVPAHRDVALLDLVDNLLNKGVVLEGELTLGLADVDLVYARLAVLLCAADRLRPLQPQARGPRRGAAQRAKP